MSAIAALAASLTLALGFAGCSTHAAQNATQVPASFVVAPAGRFDIRLEANPSTGYRWQVGEPLDEKVVRLVGSDFQRAPAAGDSTPAPLGTDAAPLVGQGGIETWRFEALAPGRTTIELVYVRPWERDVAPARRAVYSVEVR